MLSVRCGLLAVLDAAKPMVCLDWFLWMLRCRGRRTGGIIGARINRGFAGREVDDEGQAKTGWLVSCGFSLDQSWLLHRTWMDGEGN